MATVANKRSIMTLHSDPRDPYSHQVRIVLAEKGVAVDILPIDLNRQSPDLLQLNPYGTLPVLVDRDLVLYESRIIMEYLDERFPHPPLMPVYPVTRAECRRMMYRIDRDWYSKMNQIFNEDLPENEIEATRNALQKNLEGIASLFGSRSHFLSDEFTLVDCWLAPLLWRLPTLGIDLAAIGENFYEYAQRLFRRESFRMSLSDAERELKAA